MRLESGKWSSVQSASAERPPSWANQKSQHHVRVFAMLSNVLRLHILLVTFSSRAPGNVRLTVIIRMLACFAITQSLMRLRKSFKTRQCVPRALSQSVTLPARRTPASRFGRIFFPYSQRTIAADARIPQPNVIQVPIAM